MKLKLLSIPVILSAIVLMSFNGGGGGDKCKFDFEKADKFTGKMIRYDNYNLAQTLKLQLGDNAGQLYVSLGAMVIGENLNAILTTDTLFLKLENNSIVSVIPNEMVKPTAQLYGASVVTTYSTICNITKDQATILSKSKIVALKYAISGKPYTAEVSDKKAVKMMGTFSCLLQ